ncbi:MAG: leucine-rich repeat protein [Candidatus Azobacteroides sp.]|nr:leucine-rich repeat protein [Candidatus Azobacteroides sp.]
MKYKIILFFFILHHLLLVAQEKPDPGTSYPLTIHVSPENAGYTYPSIGETQQTAGQEITIAAYANRNYNFKEWKLGNNVISTYPSFNYMMPAEHIQLTAVFEYDPVNPDEPEAIPLQRKLFIDSSPAEGGYFNVNSETIFREGERFTIQAYPNMNYAFEGWKIEGKIVSTSPSYEITFGKNDISVTGVFRYEPENPSGPNTNYWNALTGELIMDDFKSGQLYNAINNTIAGNTDKVLRLIVVGEMSDYDVGVIRNLTNCSEVDLSRVTGLNRIPAYAFSYFGMNKIILSADIEEIGEYAFNDCRNLTELICYAFDPPMLGGYAFININENLIVQVMQAAIPGYMEKEG